ncbi:MAG: hypothetical protein AUK48_07070 [Oscillatoriales cyanobacterium CG2_30_44_21]|nr:MAG: hypothetical protein AUK48_07070 [Oscillatoriales cyanobacterium CG2_30_44_21]
MTIEQRNNKPSIAADTNQPNKGQLVAYKNLKDIKAKHEADGTTHSADYKTNQGNLERLESRFPSLTEPSIDKTVHDNTESNKDGGSKPITQSDDGQSSTTATDDDKDNTTQSNSSEPTHLGPASGSDPFANLRKRMGETKGNTETSNSTEPNTKTDSHPLDKYRGESKENTEIPNSTEPAETGDRDIK